MNSRSDPRLSRPLLVGQRTDTPLDLVTNRLLFIWPLTDKQVEWLNTVIYQDSLFYVNYWSLTHTFFGIVWGLLMVFGGGLGGGLGDGLGGDGLGGWGLTVFGYIVIHTLFEIWEAWAGGYFTGEFQLTLEELVDGAMDTLFGLAGVWAVLWLFGRRDLMGFS